VYVELLEMCVFCDWKFTARAEWLEIYRACPVIADVLLRLPSGWKCTVHDEWLEIYIAIEWL
jgi:hypothetical protein